MTASFDFVSADDKPALIAFSTPEWLETAKAALRELGYKVHTAATHSDFLVRFGQVHYQVVKHSVHAVISSSEMFLLKQLIEKAVADNTLFLQSYREVQSRIYSSATRT